MNFFEDNVGLTVLTSITDDGVSLLTPCETLIEGIRKS